MKIKNILYRTRKWLRYFMLAFMLGFSNVFNQETKTIDDTLFKMEQTSENDDNWK